MQRQDPFSVSKTSRGRRARCCSPKVICVSLLLAMLVLGVLVACVVGAKAKARYERQRIGEACVRREGREDRCWVDDKWARCVAANGAGFCEGV
jgi:hypothetical protein